MFHLDCPWAALLLPLPFLIKKLRLPFFKSVKEEVPELYFPEIHRLKNAFPHNQGKKNKDILFQILFSLSWIFLILALMQPEKVDQFNSLKNTGYDLLLAVDISSSMEAVDFSTQKEIVSRLDATKAVVSDFVLKRQGDRVGLITFGESAYLHVPLTLDTVSVSKMLTDTVSGMAGNATAIGDAISLGVKILRERPEESRVLILLTDGEDNASSIPPMESAKLAKQYGIRVYTIGIGRTGLAPYPTSWGGYGMVKVSIDEKLLKDIASLTGGHFFLASDQKSLESIYSKIDQLEKTEVDETIFLVRDPLFLYPLSISMLLLLILFLGELKKRRTLGS